MKNKQKKNEFDSDFENQDLNVESPEEDLAEPELTKAQRKMIKNSKKNSEDRSQLDHYDKSDFAEARRYAKSHKFKVFFVTLTIVLLLSVVAALIVFAILQSKNGPSTNDYKVYIGNENFDKKEPTYEFDYKDSNRYGQFYFDLKLISTKYRSEIKPTGDTRELKFTCNDGTYVSFRNEHNVAKVNGTDVDVGGNVYIIDATEDEDIKCLVPFTFIENLFSHKADKKGVGLKILKNNDNSIYIGKINNGDSPDHPISFSADCFKPSTIDYYSSLPTNYVDNATAMALKTSRLELVNKSYRLDEEDISPDNLISLVEFGCPIDTNENIPYFDFFDPVAALALTAMINEANKTLEGDEEILVSSAFRSFDYQEKIHERYIDNYMDENDLSEDEARAEVEFFSAPAGASEHHLGICVDVIDKGHHELSERFEEREAFEWLSKNAHKYGFIIRYPKDKTDITKYDYEPWHYRFVGIQAATFMHVHDLTLEEFLGKLN